MISKLSLKAKLILGSSLPLIIVVIVGVISTNSIASLLSSNKWVDHTNRVIRDAMNITASAVDMETGMRGYLLAGKEEFLEPYNNGYKNFDRQVEDLQETVNDNPAQVALLEEIKTTIDTWVADVTGPQIELRREIGNGKAMQDIAALVGEARGKQYFDKFRSQIALFIEREATLLEERKAKLVGETDVSKLVDANIWVQHTYEVMSEANEILASAVDMETGMRGYLLAGKEEFLDPYNAGQSAFEEQVSDLKNTVSDNPAQVQLLGEIEANISEWVEQVTKPQIALRREIGDSKAMQDIAALVGEARGKQYFDAFRSKIGTFIEREQVLMEERKGKAEALAARTRSITIGGISLAVVVSAICSLVLGSRITARFKKLFMGLKSFSDAELKQLGQHFDSVIEGLTTGAEKVASVSSQVNASSQQLASGASEQASSIEEISSTLEELASITKRNAQNADEANSLSSQAEQEAMNGKQAMHRMADKVESMSDAVSKIKDSSDKTSNIIKTIDEVAFQTNILALNAAVEAARAGEAGRGFAVVAEEVRNLAQRCAQAARDTAALIEESATNAEGGVKASEDVKEGLQKVIDENIAVIVDGIVRVREINSEVSSASNEQNTGIGQVNEAVAQMSDLTQSNAASAEESSAASEELSTQSIELNDQMEILVQITKGDGESSRPSDSMAFALEDKKMF